MKKTQYLVISEGHDLPTVVQLVPNLFLAVHRARQMIGSFPNRFLSVVRIYDMEGSESAFVVKPFGIKLSTDGDPDTVFCAWKYNVDEKWSVRFADGVPQFPAFSDEALDAIDQAPPGEYRVRVMIDGKSCGADFDTLAQAFGIKEAIPPEYCPRIYNSEGLVEPSPTTVGEQSELALLNRKPADTLQGCVASGWKS